MFPTIFAIGIDGLGDSERKLGSALIVMAIIGGAVLTALMGATSDRGGIHIAMSIPVVCFGVERCDPCAHLQSLTRPGVLRGLARSMRSHGWTRDMTNREELEAASPWIDPRFLFVHLGYNLRPMEVQAAFGLVQLRRLEEFNEARRRNARRLLAGLRDLDGKLEFVAEQEGGRSTWFGFPVMVQDAQTRVALSEHLERNGIETRAIVAGNLAVQPAFRDSPHRTVGSLANATAIGQRGLFIGNHPRLDDRRVDHIVETFHSFFAQQG
jgi:CDP-6-deoxy-D-xylo-4-hexulose-3-dehydrase